MGRAGSSTARRTSRTMARGRSPTSARALIRRSRRRWSSLVVGLVRGDQPALGQETLSQVELDRRDRHARGLAQLRDPHPLLLGLDISAWIVTLSTMDRAAIDG